MIQLTTKRLIIRDPLLTDIDGWHLLLSDAETMYYLQGVLTHSVEASRQNLEIAVEEAENTTRKKYFFAIENKDTGTFIGSIGYTVTQVTPLGKLVGLGYFILPNFHGKGYITEALNEVMRFAFVENDVYRISAGCLIENQASERVMKKCGLVKEAEYKFFTWHDGKMKDRVEYRLLRDEWQAKLK